MTSSIAAASVHGRRVENAPLQTSNCKRRTGSARVRLVRLAFGVWRLKIGVSFAAVALCSLHLAAHAQVRLFPSSGAVNPDAAATLVVFNETDRDSRELARYYAERRGIPQANLVGLKCATFEEINREEFDATIAEPLRRALSAGLHWKLREMGSPLSPVEWNKIRFVALMRGIPLKISPVAAYAGDKPNGPEAVAAHNEAAVDSELAILALRSRQISGIVGNPYYRAYSRLADFKLPELLLVCRLDGPTPAIVRQMIDDSIAAEKEGLPGFVYVDARGLKDGGYAEGDEWLKRIAADARRRGSPVILDDGPEQLPIGYPMGRVAMYFGWYAQDLSGALATPGFRFQKGAVAVHIHSYSAATVRSEFSAWVGPLLRLGAVATLGNVFEPFLSLTPNLDIFHDRLRAGFTFAESAYMSQRFLSWQTTFVGDPLYRPYPGGTVGEEKPTSGEWAEYRAGARQWYGKNRAAAEATLRASARRLGSGLIYEGLGLLEVTVKQGSDALGFFREARNLYKKPEDICRVAIHEIFQLKSMTRETEALTLSRKMIATYPKEPAIAVFALFEPPPPPPPPPPVAAPVAAPVRSLLPASDRPGGRPPKKPKSR